MENLIVMLFLVLLLASVCVGSAGSYRKIGFGKAFFASLFFTPIIGLLFVIESERNSDYELKKTIYHYITSKTAIILVLLMISVSIFGQTQNEYSQYTKQQTSVGKIPVSYDEWAKWYTTIQPQKNTFLSPGDYLIKARNQILSGFGMQVASVVYMSVIASTQEYDNMGNPTKNLSGHYAVGSLLCLAGMGFEIAGIFNIGNAGLSLNSNGVGIKVKF